MFQRSLKFRLDRDDPRSGQLRHLSVYQQNGEVARAMENFDKSLKIANEWRIGILGHVVFQPRQFYRGIRARAARAHYEKARALFEIVGDVGNA
jgi:hypothetical protein